MPIIRRDKRTAALQGLERGIGNGIQIGFQARRVATDEQDSQAHRDLAMQRAKQINDELMREDSERQATGEAAGELGNIAAPQKPNMGGGAQFGPAIAAGSAGAAQQGQLDRVKEIAKRLPQNLKIPFVETVRDRHKELIDKQKREAFKDKLSRDEASGALFGTQPDGARQESKATQESAQHMLELAGDPRVPIEKLESERVGLKRAVGKDRTAQKHLQDTLLKFDTDIATVDQGHAAGPQTPGSMAGGILQRRKLQGLRDEYEQFSDELLRDPESPTAMKFLQEFSGRWAQAKNGIAFEDKELGPVTFEAAGQIQQAKQAADQVKQENDGLKQRLAEMEHERKVAADKAKEPLIQAQTDKARQEGLSSMVRANAYASTGGARGQNAGKRALSYKDAAGIVDARNPKPEGDARRDAIREEMNTADAANGPPQPSEGVKAGSDPNAFGAQWPQWVLDEEKALDTPAKRRAAVEANPAKYKGRWKTKAEAEAWEANGGR